MMVWTLQRYIFREMGKTFLLTAVGLMVVLGLGGGIMNMIELEQITLIQMIKLMGLVLPVALALTLPIAALFSAATTYGRLSADNEFVACRSSGINILTLFAPTLIISLVSAVVTFAFINFIIPGLVRNLNTLIRADLEQIVVQGIRAPGGFPVIRDRFRFFADHTAVEHDPDDPGAKWVRLDGVVFVETDEDQWVRSGSADTVVLSFDTMRDDPTVTADMYDVSLIDHRKRQSAELRDHLRIGPHPVPRRFPLKVKWLNLSELLHYLAHPEQWSKVRELIERVRGVACGIRFYDRLIDEFAGGGRVRLGDDAAGLLLRADGARRDPSDGRVHFEGRIEITESSERGRRRITADRAVVLFEPGRRPTDARAAVELFDNVTLADPTDRSRTIRKQRARLDPVRIGSAVTAGVAKMNTDELLRHDAWFAPGSVAAQKRDEAVRERDTVAREIAGVLHSRLAFSVSVFALVILAAALGIIFRGSHVLTAFGIAFVPAVVVIVTIVMGRQMAENPGTPTLGLGLLWSGIVAVTGLDAWVLLKVLRR